MANQFRMYTFVELMTRLLSKHWSVVEVKDGYIFMPSQYLRTKRKGDLL